MNWLSSVPPPAYLSLAVAAIWANATLIPSEKTMASWVCQSGWLPVALGVFLVGWTSVTLHSAGTTVRPHGEPAVLVVVGPFRFTRNPIYLGMVLVVLGVSLVVGQATNLLVPLTLAAVIHYGHVRKEETVLRIRFGENYQAYCDRVPRWLAFIEFKKRAI